MHTSDRQIIDPYVKIQTFPGRYVPDRDDLYDLYIAHVAGWEPYCMTCMIQDIIPGLDLYYADRARHPTTADRGSYMLMADLYLV